MIVVAALALVVLMALVLALCPEPDYSRNDKPVADPHQYCTPSSCGNIGNISYPFRLKDDPSECGVPECELGCENSRTTLFLFAQKYYVREIFHDVMTIRVVDASLDEEDSCGSISRYSLTYDNFRSSSLSRYSFYLTCDSVIVIMKCTRPVMNSSDGYVDVTPCIISNNSRLSSSPNKTYFYAFYGYFGASDIHENCSNQAVVPASCSNNTTTALQSISDIHAVLLMGFDLYYWAYWPPDFRTGTLKDTWKTRFQLFLADLRLGLYEYLLTNYGYRWIFSGPSSEKGWVPSIIIKVLMMGRTLLGVPFFIALLIYKFRQRHLSCDDTIEEFLQSHNNFMPIRYSYTQIKEITKGFKDKLGQGGFGSVYKGKLQSGHLVAVKVLGKSKANGQDFISEVATIGRIHHVNVVRLAGFCAEGSKRALVYDFMVNGSLDKFIFLEGEKTDPLSWKTMYEIGLGVARGIEYLHRGCNIQILHFDIKPHNILLDENFIPKVSDFGLAKLYPVDESIVSLTAARGTLGYIAPELFYKNIGGISYKADVYSFGMLLMEMVGRRKNVNAFAEHSSQIYFPTWTYDRISQGEEIELGITNEDEQKFAKKMIIVALWCIQLKPTGRPSMSKVLEMLESEVELLQIPPKPFLNPQEMSVVDHPADIDPKAAPVSSYNAMDTVTLDVR